METAAQSLETAQPRADKWTQGVMELIQLTQKGKLHWRRITEPSKVYGETYEALFSGNTLTLRTQSIFAESFEKHSFWSTSFSPPKMSIGNERIHPSLRVTNGSYVVTIFPDIAALSGLAETVQEKTAENDEAFLQAIHQATKSVAE